MISIICELRRVFYKSSHKTLFPLWSSEFHDSVVTWKQETSTCAETQPLSLLGVQGRPFGERYPAFSAFCRKFFIAAAPIDVT